MYINSYKINENNIVFDCGCRIPVIDGRLMFCANSHDTHFNVNFDCQYTYKMLCEGFTEGIFQLNSPLGKQWTMKVAPNKLDHIVALGALLRPSCLESKDEEGISTTIHYERRKNNKEPTPTYNPVVDNILKDTYNCLLYQEQAIEIVKACAGFTLEQADSLRRAAGKKIVSEMQSNKKMFLEKAVPFGVLTEQQSIEVFNWIEASQRYAFNLAHSVEYATRSYITAFIKAHFPINFFKSWLKNENKREKYTLLVNEAKVFNIKVRIPEIRHMKIEFYSLKNDIYFGLGNIKHLVKSDIDKIAARFTELNWSPASIGKTVTWLEFLHEVLYEVSSKTAEALIYGGALDCFCIDRAIMAYEYEKYSVLSPTERKTFAELLTKNTGASLSDLLTIIQSQYTFKYFHAQQEYKDKSAKRAENGKTYKKELAIPKVNQRSEKLGTAIEQLVKPIYTIQDTIDSLINNEEEYLGVAITHHASDNIRNAVENATCLDILRGRRDYSVLKVKLDQVRGYNCANGSIMAFIECSDSTGKLTSVVAFGGTEENPGPYLKYRHLLVRDNLVLITGSLGDKGSFIINKAWPIS